MVPVRNWCNTTEKNKPQNKGNKSYFYDQLQELWASIWMID